MTKYFPPWTLFASLGSLWIAMVFTYHNFPNPKFPYLFMGICFLIASFSFLQAYLAERDILASPQTELDELKEHCKDTWANPVTFDNEGGFHQS